MTIKQPVFIWPQLLQDKPPTKEEFNALVQEMERFADYLQAVVNDHEARLLMLEAV